MDFDFQQFFTKLWMHELRQILLNPYRIYGLSGSLSPLGCEFVPRFVINKKGCTQLAIVRDKVCQLPAQDWLFPPGTLASSATNRDASQKSITREVAFAGRGLIRRVVFGGRGLIREVAFGGRGLIREVAFGGRGRIREVAFGGRGLIRGRML